MAAYTPRWAGKWRAFIFPACPLPPERQRYFDTFSRLYVIAIATYALALLPMFWLLGNSRLFTITLVGLGTGLGARELHRRGHMTSGVSLLLAVMTWHMLESIHAFGGGVGFELYFALILLIVYISALPPAAKGLVSLSVLALTALQLTALGGQAPSWPYSPLAHDILLVANLTLISVLFGVILRGLEGVTERLERNYRREASLDALTGVYNRRAVLKAAEQAAHGERSFALLLVDIDYFKRINDEYGHELGDRALCHLVECLRLGLRDEDVLGRYGGEEFIVVLNDMTLTDAMGVADRLTAQVRERPFATALAPLHMTISIGVAVSSQASGLDALIALADRRLYHAKRSGRDRAVGEDVASGIPTKDDPAAGVPAAGVPATANWAADRLPASGTPVATPYFS